MRFRLLAISGMLLPATALAATVLEYDFTGEPTSHDWTNQGLTSVQTSIQGVMISTDVEGQFRKDIEPGHYEAIEITYASSQHNEVLLLWQDAQRSDSATGVPLTFPASPTPTTVAVNLKTVEGWNPSTNRIGFQIGAGAEILIMDVTLTNWNIFEHTWYALKSFWNFDQVRAYTINFVWGPLLAFNPVEIDQTFWRIPPELYSYNWVLYAVLLIALIIVAYISFQEGSRSTHHWWKKFFMLFFAFWILYDIRMTAELAHYVKTDNEMFYSQDFANQQFRDRGYFIQLVDAARATLQQEEEFVFLPFVGYPYMGQLRYMVYPSTPVNPDAAGENTKLWFVFNRPDIQINEAGELVANGEVLSPPGEILEVFTQGTFFFRAQ